MIYFTAQGSRACCATNRPITTGSVGLPVVFEFDADWDGLTKTAVFTGSGVSLDQMIGADNTLAVPWECLQSAGGVLIIGVRGALEDGTVVVPTVLARAGVIERGAAISGVSPSDPTPSWADEVKAQAAEALERAQVFPAGGEAGQVLTKQSGADYDAAWEDQTGGGGSADIDLGITGASVGQRATVAAVDEDGKPTSWRAETPPQPWDGSSEGGTEPAGVISVNGQTGTVVLDASDVGAYEKPSAGIPKADLAAGVQTSLGKADTALQQHQSLAAYRTAADQDDIDTAQDTAIAGKQSKITASGILKGDGSGGVSAATAGTDYATPAQIPQPWDGSTSGGSAPSGVVSVNGQTGTVVLDAEDVGAGTYSKPSGGIPASDLASAVQTSLGKADTALQSVPSTYRTAAAQDVIDAAKLNKPASTGTADQILGLDSQLNPTWQDRDRVVTVTGTTPTITALPGVRYVCGEVTTLDITLPASGVVDVTFESGSTATVLTITPPTGVTLKWANGFDPTALEAETTYELSILDGLGVAAQWT